MFVTAVLGGGAVTIHHAGSPVASHLVILLSILSYRITLYDYQAMCRANKDSSDGASRLLDVSMVQSPKRTGTRFYLPLSVSMFLPLE